MHWRNDAGGRIFWPDKESTHMFTIFRATGKTGSGVANALLSRGEKGRVLVGGADKAASLAARGAEVALGDVTDAASVAKPLSGARGAYFLVPPDPASNDLIGRGRRVVDGYVAAVRQHGLPHAVLLSSVGAQ